MGLSDMFVLAGQEQHLERMSDEDVAKVWKSIWKLAAKDRPSGDLINLVYSEMGKRGLPCIHGDAPEDE